MHRFPRATYRVQFNRDFRFEDALNLVPDLHQLGISHLYASPVFAARAGSTHGYDVTDPNRFNPELGTEEDFHRLADALHERGMGLILDIVPNHMAASPENSWWMDVLENGAASRFAGYFGINWGADRPNVEEKIFLPILGEPYGEVLDKGQLQLSYEDGGFFVSYYEARLPVAPVTYRYIIEPACEPLGDDPEARVLLESIERLAPRTVTDWDALQRRQEETKNIKTRIRALVESSPDFRGHIDRALACLNGTPGDPNSFEPLHELLENQAYRLSYWRVARERINYRRFFDVSDLIGMRVESDEVFRASHALVLSLVEQGKVDGLRVDHIDGLNDPSGYLKKLPADVYKVVEKILVGTERLPEHWQIAGTSGYDFLGYLNALFVAPEGLQRISWYYRDVIGFRQSLEDVEYNRKHLAMQTLFPGEMEDLGASLEALAQQDRYARDLSPLDLTQALKELTACLPVYRTYAREGEMSEQDRSCIKTAMDHAMKRVGDKIDFKVFDFTRRVLMLEFRPTTPDDQKRKWERFVRRWQQISGPVMAKGVEDSTFYVYNRFVSLNEVGAITRPVNIAEFHDFLQHRAEKWPGAMNGTSTHDTKRSEDVRARLNVLSEIPEEWVRHVSRWRRIMRTRRGMVDANEEYFIYQNLLGAWPLNEDEIPEYQERFRNYLIKASREARVHTNWIEPSEAFEKAITGFADLLFTDEDFIASFRPFCQKVSWYGILNSLSQTLLKVTAPGVPDFYRGTIQWDFSLVDPDNRRPVNFAPLTDLSEPAPHLFEHWRDGRVKIFVTEKALDARRDNEDLFAYGDYIPVEVTGKQAGHLIAFARRHENKWALVLAPRFASRMVRPGRLPVGEKVWQDTAIILPERAPCNWKNHITGENIDWHESLLPVARILSSFPLGLLLSS